MFWNNDTIDMILLTHYFCDFNCLLLLLNHTLLRDIFLSERSLCLCNMNMDQGSFINSILGCIFTWSGSSSYVDNPVHVQG
jgi:hypothetical protein